VYINDKTALAIWKREEKNGPGVGG